MTPDPAAAELAAIRARSQEAADANDRRLVRALRLAIGAGVALDLVVIAAALLLGGRADLLGALVGTGAALVVTLPTLLTAHLGRRLGPAGMAGLVMGAWLVKMIVLIVVLVLLPGEATVSRPWLGIALLVGAVAPAVIEAWLMTRSRARIEAAPGAGDAPRI